MASSDAMLVKQQRGKFQVTGLQEGWTKKTHTFARVLFGDFLLVLPWIITIFPRCLGEYVWNFSKHLKKIHPGIYYQLNGELGGPPFGSRDLGAELPIDMV